MKTLVVLFLMTLLSCQQNQRNSEDGGNGNSQIQAGTTSWPASQFPISLKISNAFDNNQTQALDEMTSQWSQAVESQIDYFNNNSDPSNQNLVYSNLNDYNDNEMGVYVLESWNPALPATALAVTQLFGFQYNNGSTEITHADILLNEENYDFTTDEFDNSKYDFHTVMLHELGHFLGLSHIGFETVSIMNPSISTSDVVRSPFQDDKVILADTYGLTTTHNQNTALSAERIHAAVQAENTSDQPKKFVKILIHLMADGECQHTVNGELVHTHKVNLKK